MWDRPCLSDKATQCSICEYGLHVLQVMRTLDKGKKIQVQPCQLSRSGQELKHTVWLHNRLLSLFVCRVIGCSRGYRRSGGQILTDGDRGVDALHIALLY